MSKQSKKIIGVNFLNRHPGMESRLNVPDDHVIVDKKDWEEIVRLCSINEQITDALNAEEEDEDEENFKF